MGNMTTRLMIGDDQFGRPIEVEQVIEDMSDDELLEDWSQVCDSAVEAELRKRHLIDQSR